MEVWWQVIAEYVDGNWILVAATTLICCFAGASIPRQPGRNATLSHPLPFSFPSLFPPLPSFPSLFPPLPFQPIFPSLRSRPFKFSYRGLGELCKLLQRGLGRSPSRNRIWCILALKYDIWWQQFKWFSWEPIYQILCTLNSIKANRDHGVPRVILFKARFFSFHYCECKQFKH